MSKKKKQFEDERVEKSKWNIYLQSMLTFGNAYDDLIKSYEIMENDEDEGRAVFRGALRAILTMLSPYIGYDKTKEIEEKMKPYWKNFNCEDYLIPIFEKEILPLCLKHGFLPERKRDETPSDKLKRLDL